MPTFPCRATLACTLLMLLAAPGLAQNAPAQDFDDFWEEEPEQAEALPERLGTGAGPMMVYLEQSLGSVNDRLESAGLLALPEQQLYWGGAAWFSIPSGGPLHVALGGGAYGGGSSAERGADYAHRSVSAGFFSAKGILPVHRHLYLEGGVHLGGGASSVVVERTDVGSGIVNVHLRGSRGFAMLRGVLGLDIRLARWIGILVEGGYGLTVGEWSLVGDEDLLDGMEFDDSGSAHFSVMVRFGI